MKEMTLLSPIIQDKELIVTFASSFALFVDLHLVMNPLFCSPGSVCLISGDDFWGSVLFNAFLGKGVDGIPTKTLSAIFEHEMERLEWVSQNKSDDYQ
jgi:hypothetical protein